MTASPRAHERLTTSGLVNIELIAPPPAVAPYVTTFFLMRCDEQQIRDVQPSSIGIVAVMAKGSGRMHFADGRIDRSERFLLVGPTSAAAMIEVDGPWHSFGAMLSPLGWASLTGLSAAEHGNRIFAGAEPVAAPMHEAARRLLDRFDALPPPEMADILGTAILASRKRVPQPHIAFVRAVADWIAGSLSPDIKQLFATGKYGPRQIQRLCERYFGLPPSALARKYRALRAAVILSRPSLTVDEISAVQDHFYDQSHMIREIRLFAGRTPARVADPDMPYLAAFLDQRDFRGRGPRMAPIPNDLRA